MHNLSCSKICSKFQTKLTTFLGSSSQKTTQKKPKMTVSAGKKAFENLKLKSRTTDPT